MARKNLLSRLSQSGESEALKDVFTIPDDISQDQKIDVEIRDIIRVRPQDFSALKNSFEEWAKQWD